MLNPIRYSNTGIAMISCFFNLWIINKSGRASFNRQVPKLQAKYSSTPIYTLPSSSTGTPQRRQSAAPFNGSSFLSFRTQTRVSHIRKLRSICDVSRRTVTRFHIFWREAWYIPFCEKDLKGKHCFSIALTNLRPLLCEKRTIFNITPHSKKL